MQKTLGFRSRNHPFLQRTLPRSAMILFFLVSSAGWVQANDTGNAMTAGHEIMISEPEVEIIVLEDGTREIQELAPVSQRASKMVDDRYLAIKTRMRQRIDAVLEQIENLDDRSQAGELHREIERIKMDAIVERLTIGLEDAEAKGQVDLADELAEEISHLNRIDQQTAWTSQEQQQEQPIQ